MNDTDSNAPAMSGGRLRATPGGSGDSARGGPLEAGSAPQDPPRDPAPGVKNDDGKARWDLLPWHPLALVVAVLTFGARKYAPGNWRHVPDARERYFAASMRHVAAWRGGETLDPESNLPHLAHALCSLLFVLALDLHTPGDA